MVFLSKVVLLNFKSANHVRLFQGNNTLRPEEPYLFVGSAQGGRTAAVLYSFTSTCHRLAIEPWAYLQDVLTRLPATPAEGLTELLPDVWQAARQAAAATSSSPASSATPNQPA
jgi:hypothetical protein